MTIIYFLKIKQKGKYICHSTLGIGYADLWRKHCIHGLMGTFKSNT